MRTLATVAFQVGLNTFELQSSEASRRVNCFSRSATMRRCSRSGGSRNSCRQDITITNVLGSNSYRVEADFRLEKNSSLQDIVKDELTIDSRSAGYKTSETLSERNLSIILATQVLISRTFLR